MQSIRTIRRNHGLELRRGVLCVATALAAVAFAAAPASAGNEFKDGFEDELGRLVAHEAIRAGKIALFGPLAIAKYHHDRVIDHRRDRRGHDRHDWRGPRRVKHVEVHYHGGRPCELLHGKHAQFRGRGHGDRHWKHDKRHDHYRKPCKKHRYH